MKLDSAMIESFENLFSEAQHIIITNHVNPDGDAMGSALGLNGVLSKLGFSTRVIVPNSYPDFLSWMSGHDDVLVFEENEEEAHAELKKSDLIIHLDYNALHRSGPMINALQNAEAKRMLIDHHQQPESFPDAIYSDTSMSSTSEMVFHLLKALNWDDSIGLEEASCLYTGIITDTGNFRFSSTSPQTHAVAARFLEIGVQPHEIAALVYDTNTGDRLKLLSRALENMEVIPESNAVLIHLSQSDLQEFSFKKGDTEGFVNYGLSLLGIRLSVFLSEKDGMIKISFRSKGKFDVNKLARAHFNGGGHINAAGGMSEESLEDTLNRLKNILPEYNRELNEA